MSEVSLKVSSASFRFGEYLLLPADRRLLRDDSPVEINGRYFDALALLVREQGRLVTKDRFMDEVWRGVPVTDEALTQCIRTLRRQLGDDAGRPRFIETVPKHGYRFIAGVEEGTGATTPAAATGEWQQLVPLALGGTIGGTLAGVIGGLVYGFAGSFQPLAPGVSAVSVLLVLLCLTAIIAVVGSAGVAFGIASSGLLPGGLRRWCVLGGALGGLLVGAVVELLGLDAFTLLFGHSPGNITGALEGAVLGGAVGLGVWIALRRDVAVRRSISVAALVGGVAGVVIALAGGRLMLGSLDELARHVPGSRLRLDMFGTLFGEQGLGPVTGAVSGGLEAALFAAGVVGGMLVAARRQERI